MTKAILRWSIPLFGLLAVGPLAGLCTIGLRARDGSDSVTPMLAASPVLGIGMGLAAVLIAGGYGVIATWVNGIKSGLFTTGLVLAWATWGTGNMDDILRRSQSSAELWKLGAEGVIFGLLGLGLALVLWNVHERRLKMSVTLPDAGAAAPTVAVAERAKIRSQFIAAAGSSTAVMAAVVWIAATEPTKGQALAAATIGAMLATAAGKWAAHHAPMVAYFVGAAVLGAAAPIAAKFYHGTDSGLVRAALGGTLFPLARLVPMDWLAGGFMGVPMGLSIASGLMESHQHQPHAQAS
ncbi:MAG: hypothetical protein AB7G11_16860 [Phycisphaerales bacterium]